MLNTLVLAHLKLFALFESEISLIAFKQLESHYDFKDRHINDILKIVHIKNSSLIRTFLKDGEVDSLV